jgi:cytochrome c-type biogenesis protein CcmE
MKPKHQRLIFIILMLSLSAAALFWFLRQIEDNIVYFYAPSELDGKNIIAGENIRVGGLVVDGSIKSDGDTLIFALSDGKAQIMVNYVGIVPNLFRAGQGIVAEGELQGKVLLARQILAKHDENYMPPEVTKTLKNNNQWMGNP